MDLKALRAPTFTALELATARASTQARAPRLVHSAARPERVLEPVARSEIWEQYHAGAIRDGHPEPERFADAAVRERTQTLLKKEKRAKVAFLSDPPKPPTAAAIEAGSKPSARNKAPATKCQAKTLEGRQCGFAATCGPFCKKHAPKEPPRPPFQLVTDARRFTNARLKGFVNAKPSVVTKVLGPPNGLPNDLIEAEWKLVFADGTPATLFYSRSDPSLHVCGEDVGVIGRVRQLLAL
jgi:hypothetical protein